MDLNLYKAQALTICRRSSSITSESFPDVFRRLFYLPRFYLFLLDRRSSAFEKCLFCSSSLPYVKQSSLLVSAPFRKAATDRPMERKDDLESSRWEDLAEHSSTLECGTIVKERRSPFVPALPPAIFPLSCDTTWMRFFREHLSYLETLLTPHTRRSSFDGLLLEAKGNLLGEREKIQVQFLKTSAFSLLLKPPLCCLCPSLSCPSQSLITTICMFFIAIGQFRALGFLFFLMPFNRLVKRKLSVFFKA